MATKKTVKPAKKTVKPVKKAAPSKKTSKRLTNKALVEEWTEGYRPFIEACQKHFAFLVRDYAFSGPEVSVLLPDCLVKYTREGAFVRAASEYGGPPWVVVKAGDGEPFGLHVIVAELEPEHEKQKPQAKGAVLTPEEMEAFVAYWAGFLERHAKEILSGDPKLLGRFKARENALRAAPP
jgi:hypothetical protein